MLFFHLLNTEAVNTLQILMNDEIKYQLVNTNNNLLA
jgi:hypothetical protein